MVTRINGFSGMDVDSMVKNLMTAKRIPMDKLSQQKQTMQWTRDSYREMNSKFVDFQTNKLNRTYGLSAAMNSQKAVTSGNTDALKAVASANANGVDMTVSITQLALKGMLETNGKGSTFTASSTLTELGAASPGTYNLNVNGQAFSFTSETPISTIISKINSNADAKVSASFDEIKGKLIVTSNTLGATGEVKLGVGATDNTLLDVFGGVKQNTFGKDAIVFINNTKMIKNNNTFTVNGVSLTLLATTVNSIDPTIDPFDSGEANNPTKITIQSDPTKAIDTIKSFVADYNNLLSAMNSKISEEKYRDFPPLTDEQKVDMKEDDITKWTEKAKSGVLKNDDILRSTISNMRTLISEKIGSLSSIGITTGQYYEGGKLYLDEEKLTKALNANSQTVAELFQGSESAPKDGIFDKLAAKIDNSLDSLAKRVGTNKFSTDITSAYNEQSVMGKRLKEYNSRISDMLTNLSNAETRYYKQFSAMETAMNKLTAQSSSLLSSMGQS
ncbi:flagellar filament capping protein FliD [Paenibacillus wynnii]|uniref:Flagellar hook-associated protein 2 n=1 Tax=Paenibacillus wynnii TaxID=268407 RepID=A0A098MED6_9BACL|nr:flagellar filament capping protein FliD [Paenibacillus wynnii]KGE20416.1 hypothetical protein PWYN_14495 [Paenibacillus wynnii]